MYLTLAPRYGPPGQSWLIKLLVTMKWFTQCKCRDIKVWCLPIKYNKSHCRVTHHYQEETCTLCLFDSTITLVTKHVDKKQNWCNVGSCEEALVSLIKGSSKTLFIGFILWRPPVCSAWCTTCTILYLKGCHQPISGLHFQCDKRNK